ncbi:MAG: putative Ig domain-containing protein [Planctomycetia bacterium]|nr:putative Ig domain-containing protein [Planctomycetia bacterium]
MACCPASGISSRDTHDVRRLHRQRTTPRFRPRLEALEDRWTPSLDLITRFLAGDPELAHQSNAFVAKGRVGSAGYPGQNFTFELDVNKSTAGPFGLHQTADYQWHPGGQDPIELIYTPGNGVEWRVGGQPVFYTQVNWSPTDDDAITLRTASYLAGASVELRDLHLQVGGDEALLRTPDGTGSAVVRADNSKQLLLIQGVDLQQGFVLRGVSAWNYTNRTVKQSQLAFQIGVGNWRNVPTVGNPGPQASAERDHVELQLEASDPEGDPLTYSASALPDGRTIDPHTGLISGTLSCDAYDQTGGQTTVTVTVTDPQGHASSQSFVWTVGDVAVKDVYWTGAGGDLDWNNIYNWSILDLPDCCDAVFIDDPDITVYHEAGDVCIHSLHSLASLDFTGGLELARISHQNKEPACFRSVK